MSDPLEEQIRDMKAEHAQLEEQGLPKAWKYAMLSLGIIALVALIYVI